MAKLVDAHVSHMCAGNGVRVRIPLRARPPQGFDSARQADYDTSTCETCIGLGRNRTRGAIRPAGFLLSQCLHAANGPTVARTLFYASAAARPAGELRADETQQTVR